MGMTNAEKQAAWRERQAEKVRRVAELEKEVKRLRSDVVILKGENGAMCIPERARDLARTKHELGYIETKDRKALEAIRDSYEISPSDWIEIKSTIGRAWLSGLAGWMNHEELAETLCFCIEEGVEGEGTIAAVSYAEDVANAMLERKWEDEEDGD